MTEEISRSIIVERHISDVFNLWANFESFPKFMQYIKSVRRTGGRNSHWVLEGPLGRRLEWDAETTAMEANSRIAWQSTGGDLETGGKVYFRELAPDRTEITILLNYELAGSVLDRALVRMFADPERRLTLDLNRFKAYAEAFRGVVPVPSGIVYAVRPAGYEQGFNANRGVVTASARRAAARTGEGAAGTSGAGAGGQETAGPSAQETSK